MHWRSVYLESVYSIETEGGFLIYAIIENKNNTLNSTVMKEAHDFTEEGVIYNEGFRDDIPG